MTHHICISVTLLDPFFHGKGDRDDPEWPPSPMRLFQALVAGSRAGCRNAGWSDAKAEAFRWLERQEPPLIIAPTARPATAYALFVPNNDADVKFERQDRLTAKIVRPCCVVSSAPQTTIRQTLHYVWEISEDDWVQASPHAQLLRGEARCLTGLGWGIDQAVAEGRVLDKQKLEKLEGRQWRAWDAPLAGMPRLRVPQRGSLDDLGRAYEAFRKRLLMELPPKAREPRVFGTRAYSLVGTLPPRPHAAFELPEGIAFRQEDAAAVSAMLRSLVCSEKNLQDFRQQFPDIDTEVFLAGHLNRKRGEARSRFSYLPLPTIRHEHADGMIRRVLITEPFGGSGSYAQWAQQHLRNKVLRDHDGNERGILLGLWRSTSSAMLRQYVDAHKNWSSVTPVILPGFDDGKHVKAEKLFLQALQHADLRVEGISDFTLRKAPFWAGSKHPDCYCRPDYLDSAKHRRFSAWHVNLSFREPMVGPISLGAGRHCGLGVFATCGGS